MFALLLTGNLSKMFPLRWIDGWVVGWMDRQTMDGWVDGLMDGWVDG